MSAKTPNLLIPEEKIYAMVPDSLPVRLEKRYAGGFLHASLERDFSPEEQQSLRSLYHDLGELMDLTAKRDASDGEDSPLGAALRTFASRTVVLRAAADLEKFEQGALATHDQKLATLFRELSDGPFASLCAILFLIDSAGVEPEYFQTLFYLARDERKIMRSLLVDLDPTARAKDEAVQQHSIDLLIEKWRDAVYRAFDAELEVSFESKVEGMVAERCIEFAEVDRLFYHLVNNALKHGSGKELAIQVVESSDGNDLLWVFSNPVSGNQAARLTNLTEGRQSVFEYGVGDGSGVGLGSLAESVGHAYGIETTSQAVSGGYLGATTEDGIFRIWFHWPRA